MCCKERHVSGYAPGNREITRVTRILALNSINEVEKYLGKTLVHHAGVEHTRLGGRFGQGYAK
jgi:hypothetical protein